MAQNNKIISIENVSMRYDNRYVLENINLDVFDKDFIAITGPNGGGKTTLLKIILRLIEPTIGKVVYWNAENNSSNLKVGYLPQKNMIDSHFPITVKEVIASGLLSKSSIFSKSKEFENAVEETICQMGVEDIKNQPIGNLSGGQLQRTLLGRALISSPNILVLDEPLSYVDKRFEHQIYNIISNIAPHTTIILVSHEMTAIAPMATRHIIIDHTLHDCHADHHYISQCE
ncbi:MAG: metal ABC transporter ATP-binding protein [Muribaculaceae bacterium]|nr:metal ABC transporter ATP-binding protein [Muribaculaceae bacterium]